MTTDTSTATYRVLSLGPEHRVQFWHFFCQDPTLAWSTWAIPNPDAAIFADTGWEPDYVYRHLEWLETQLDYPLIRVSQGNLKKNLKRGITVTGHHFIDVPLYTVKRNRQKGNAPAPVHNPLQDQTHIPPNKGTRRRQTRPAFSKKHPRRNVARHLTRRNRPHEAQP